MVENIKNIIFNSLNSFNDSSIWNIKAFDINIFDVNYHMDKPVKNKLKELSNSQNFISTCFSTDSIEKRKSIKELVDILEKEIGFKIVHIKNLTTNHFYIYFEYNHNYIFDTKSRKKLISQSH